MRRDPLTAPRALVFDLDGLLVDTEEACFQTAGAVLEAHGATGVGGAELTREEYRAFVGHSIRVTYTELRERYGLAPSVEELVAHRNEHIARWYRAPVMLPGAEALVRRAHAAGLKLAIASASPGELVDVAAASMPIGSLFEVVVSADHPLVAAPKPAPDAYVTACSLLGVEPAEAIAFEDSPSGATAALAAGLTTIVVPNEWTRGGAFPDGVIVRDGLTSALPDVLSPA